jgi:hypothetical protein
MVEKRICRLKYCVSQGGMNMNNNVAFLGQRNFVVASRAFGWFITLLLGLFVSSPASAADSVCARVKK